MSALGGWTLNIAGELDGVNVEDIDVVYGTCAAEPATYGDLDNHGYQDLVFSAQRVTIAAMGGGRYSYAAAYTNIVIFGATPGGDPAYIGLVETPTNPVDADTLIIIAGPIPVVND